MILVEIARKREITNFSFSSPYVIKFITSKPILSDFWRVFGGRDPLATTKKIIGFSQDFESDFEQVFSYRDCIHQEKSFYWDNENQELFAHIIQGSDYTSSVFTSSEAVGFCDGSPVDIGGIPYNPLLLSIPPMFDRQDIINYSKPSFSPVDLIFNNMASVYNGVSKGQLDDWIKSNIYGNDVKIYYLDESIIEPVRDDLKIIKNMYVEDFVINTEQIKLRLQDKRKEQDLEIPTEEFENDFGGVIPLAFGLIKEALATPLDPEEITPIVRFRIAKSISKIGVVKVYKNNNWVIAQPSDIDLNSGLFSLAGADCRVLSGGLYSVKMCDFVGVPIKYTSDIIKILNQDYLGLNFNNSNYNIKEWEEEEIELSTGGLFINRPTKMFDVFKTIQEGSIKRFRYEIFQGKRTIRIDDKNRTERGFIDSSQIINKTKPAESDSDLVFAESKVNYSKSYSLEKYLNVKNSDNKNSVIQKYGSRKMITIDSILSTKADAIVRAKSETELFKEITFFVDLEIFGGDFIDIRIYDTFIVDLTDIERHYLGLQRVKVADIKPNLNTGSNKIRVQVVSEFYGYDYFYTESDEIITTESGSPIIAGELKHG